VKYPAIARQHNAIFRRAKVNTRITIFRNTRPAKTIFPNIGVMHYLLSPEARSMAVIEDSALLDRERIASIQDDYQLMKIEVSLR
jgi:hypothetical protein